MSFLIRILVKCILLCNLLYRGTVISFLYQHILYFDIPFKFFSRIYFLKNFRRKCHGQEARWELPVLEVYLWSRLTGGPRPAVTHLCVSSYWGYSWGVCSQLTSYLPTQYFFQVLLLCLEWDLSKSLGKLCKITQSLLPSSHIKMTWEEIKACVFQNAPNWFWYSVPVESVGIGYAWVTPISLSSSATTWISGAFELCRKHRTLVLDP